MQYHLCLNNAEEVFDSWEEAVKQVLEAMDASWRIDWEICEYNPDAEDVYGGKSWTPADVFRDWLANGAGRKQSSFDGYIVLDADGDAASVAVFSSLDDAKDAAAREAARYPSQQFTVCGIDRLQSCIAAVAWKDLV